MGNRGWLKVMAGALLFATMIYAILVAPGLLSDTASIMTVPTIQAHR